ncbi:MAG: DUF2189 domain-containing protein [Pseudomonadota bacterium]
MVRLKTVRRDAPWSWLSGGFADMMAHPVISFGYGAAFTLIGIAITLGLWWMGMLALIPVLIGGFALVAPVFAVGVYRINQVRDAGEEPKLLDFWRISPSRLTQLGLLSVLLFVFFLLWARLAQFIFAMFAHGTEMRLDAFMEFIFTTPNGVLLLGVGTAVGAFFALVAFMVSALSFPMIVDKDVDAITALVASVKAVFSQPFVMATWAIQIAFMMAVGGALFLLGIAVVFPWVAHATWRAYKDFDPQPEPSAAAASSA